MKNIQYEINLKTLNKNYINILKLKKKKNKLKKYLVSKSPFKYNKTKEQFSLEFKLLKISIPNVKYIPKFFEILLKNIFYFSNKFIFKINKKEVFFKSNI